MLDTSNLVLSLNDPSLLATQAFVGGEWIDADNGARFAVNNPTRGDEICTIPDLDVAECRRAIEAARIAQRP